MKLNFNWNNFSIFYYNIFWKSVFYWSIGLNKNFFKMIYKRFYLVTNYRIRLSSNMLIGDILYFNIFFSSCELYYNNTLSYKQLFLSYLLITDICSVYKTYRHIFGLPVNGQRTWSNACSTYYNNLLLKEYKLKKFTTFLNDPKPLSFRKVFLCEYVNLFWKKQFFLEWASVRRRRHMVQQRALHVQPKVDFNFLVNANIEHFFLRSILLKKKKSHRKKRKFNKNAFNVGWNFGFSKDYLILMRKTFYSKKKKKKRKRR